VLAKRRLSGIIACHQAVESLWLQDQHLLEVCRYVSSPSALSHPELTADTFHAVSGPPPVIESSSMSQAQVATYRTSTNEDIACRQCAKPFNPLWRRSHTCGHCGYEYCSTCLSDGQALMPRRATQRTANSSELGELRSAASSIAGDIRAAVGIDETPIEGAARGNGYDVEKVCLPCLGMLQGEFPAFYLEYRPRSDKLSVTAAPLPILRSLPIKRLKDYLEAYDIPCVGPKEKEDFVQAVVRARNPKTGCLSPEAEVSCASHPLLSRPHEYKSYYRRKSVPRHGQAKPDVKVTHSAAPRARPNPAQARPPTASTSRQPPQQNAATSRPPATASTSRPPQFRPTQPQSQPQPPRQYYQPQPARPPAQVRPPAPPIPVARSTPPPPVPTILSLVSLPKSYLSSLSIGILKAILFDNHVRVDFKQVLEKSVSICLI